MFPTKINIIASVIISTFISVLSMPVQAASNEILTAANDPEAIVDGTPAFGDKDIAEAWLIKPTTRYSHFVLGKRYEPSGIRVRLQNGQIVTLDLDDEFVFEDQVARLADLDGDGRDEVIQVMTSRQKGAALAVFSIIGDKLVLKTRTPFIGQPSRWLNPAGIADYNGDGVLDIALVQMPHLVKRLELWTMENNKLVRFAQAPNYSNHKIGSPFLGLSASADFNGDGIDDLAILSSDYSLLKLLSFADGKPEEFASFEINGVVAKNFILTENNDGLSITIPLSNGTNFVQHISP